MLHRSRALHRRGSTPTSTHGSGRGVPGLIVDLFCGGGGASLGITWATGRKVDVAVNHSAAAIAMHTLNHPDTIHFQTDVFDVPPRKTVKRRKVDILWLSPDCTHHSRARGGKPRDGKLRSLAWVGVNWARDVQPRLIFLENVPEFVTWGPLYEDGDLIDTPIPERRGEIFDSFIGALNLAGYRVEWRKLKACDYGAPTTRERLYMIARCDELPIVWPEPTHGPGRTLPWRTAAECIDWTIPCRSIFGRKKDLAEATQRRIAEGIRRYVLGSRRPFIVNLSHGGRIEPFDEPMRTITATPKGGDRALVTPFIVNTRNGERAGQAPRTRQIDSPLLTTTAAGSQGAVVAAFLAKNYTGAVGSPMDVPIGTVTAIDHHSLVAAHVSKLYGTSTGTGLDEPLHTITGQGGKHALVAAFLLKYYGEGGQWSGVDEPMHTIVTKARMGLVTVTIDGEEYVIVDIGFRMLEPRELARAQGLPDDYEITGTKEQQIARIGNSVCPDVPAALVRANMLRSKA